MPRPLPILLLVTFLPTLASAADPIPDFDRDVKPVLEQHCFKCHGPQKQKGGLRLDVKGNVLKGGESGAPAVVPGSALKSHLLKVIASPDPDAVMPPDGDRLTTAQINLLKRWVDTGAHWQAPAAAPAADSATATIPVPAEPTRQITPEDRQFWSFVPPKHAPLPPVKDPAWPANRIDHFVLARLEAASLAPAPPAPRRVLIRRLAYDLTGLPPTPEEVAAFEHDTAPSAVEKLVDRLLASPAFGERLASLWLPLARYAEDQAHQVGDDRKFFYPHAHKYRRWVIEAFNNDLPYDQFLTQQLAADLLAKPASQPTTRNSQPATHNSSLPADNPQLTTRNSQLPALGFLGLGPKYYNRGRLEVQADEWEDRVDTLTRTTLGLTVACARCHDHKFDPITAADYHALAGVFASTRMVNKTPAGVVAKGDLKPEQWDPATLHIVEDEASPKDLNLFVRGNVERKGPVVPRRFLAILSPTAPSPFTATGSGRLELARAIASRDNPLTARVIANRLWAMLLGKPLVATPSNFGRSGQPPTHPELLDDLALDLMDQNWSIKSLIKQITLSKTYQQSTSSSHPSSFPLHPSTRRLTVEQWRDTLLQVAGNLDPVTPATDAPSAELDDPANRRRTVFARISRLKLNDFLMQFDYPDANVHAEGRSVTSTPMQKLFILNSPFALRQAKAFADRLTAEAPNSDASRITRAHQLLYARNPTAKELALAHDFLAKPQDPTAPPRWHQYAQILLASNEAMYVD